MGFPEKTVFASRAGARLDSDVLSGGGSDDTEAIQAILDWAPESGGLHLVMDGAASVRGVQVHANTTIECLNPSCGFFLASGSNRSILRNANPAFYGERKDRNIALLGGTYNHNCGGQAHHVTEGGKDRWVLAMEFYGVENFTMRDVTIRDQRTFALLMANWFRVEMENISIDLPGHQDGQNQDGLHFFGPGRFLSIRGIRGRTGDDFIALAPDEHDGISDIADVLIDGVFLEEADQGIRLLSRDKGRLDRVVIRNVTGTYRSFGFYIDPWFRGTNGGHFGNIVFDTVDLRASAPNYHYTTPFLFRLGGNIESLTLRNIYHQTPSDGRSIVDAGWPTPDKSHNALATNIRSLLIDGLHIQESDDRTGDAAFINVVARVENMTVRNTEVLRPSGGTPRGCLIETRDTAGIGTLFLHDIHIRGMRSLLRHRAGEIGTVQMNNVLASETGEALLSLEGGSIRTVHADAVHGARVAGTRGGGKIGENPEGSV